MKHWKKMAASVIAISTMLAVVPTTYAIESQDSPTQATDTTTALAETSGLELLASWDFTGETGTTNSAITDSTGNYGLTLKDGAKIEQYGDRSNNEALSLRGDGQYAQIDDQLFEDAGDSFTMEFASKTRHDDSGKFFSLIVGKDGSNDTSTTNQADANKYLMFYNSKTAIKGVISDNNWGNEQGDKVTVSGNDNNWATYKIVVDGTNLAVFRNDALIIFKANTGITMSDLGATTAYIGKSFYAVDEYWDGAMDDIKVYKGASLTVPTAVTISGTGVVDGELTLIEKDSTKLIATVTPDDAVSKNVTWSSSDESVAKVSSDGVVTAVAEGTATITATTELGGVTVELPVIVQPLTDETAAAADLDAVISMLSTTTAENLPLLAEGTKNGSAITWTSSDESVITGTDADYENKTSGADDPYRGAGVITRPAYGDGDTEPITLTATATKGSATVTKTVDITVKEKTRTAPNTGYAAVTFESDNNGGERAWISSTESNNFFTFSTRNNGSAVLSNDADTGGLRDMYVLQSHDGDKYYLIATDLKVSSLGWSQNQQYGSHKVEVYESTDMMNWTRTNGGGNGGITINSPEAGMTWAPEAYWDDDLNAYVVFFSSRMYTDENRTTPVTNTTTGKSSYSQVRYSITRDFVNFTEPQMWQDTGYSRIDSTVMKIGGYYYRLTKNEESGAAGSYITTGKSVFLERSKVLTATTTEASPDTDPETGWQLLDENLLPFEGPEAIKLNDGDVNQNDAGDVVLLLSDITDQGGYQPFLTSESALLDTTWENRLSQTDGWWTLKDAEPNVTGRLNLGGLPAKYRHGAFVNVPEAVLKVTKTWTSANPTTIEAVDSTTVATYDAGARKIAVTVTAADEGTLAGSVAFTAGDWSTSVKLAADGTASVTVPNTVSGTVQVNYDGYDDGLVNASGAEVAGVEAVADPEPSPDPDPDPSPEPEPTPSDSDTAPDTLVGAADDAAGQSALSDTGMEAFGIAAVMLLLGSAGIGLTVWRQRRM